MNKKTQFSPNYIKMCIAANEIKELKFMREYPGDGLTWRVYWFDPGDYIEHLGNVQKNNNGLARHENDSKYKVGSVVHWIPIFEQLLEIRQRRGEEQKESILLLEVMYFLEYRVSREHDFCLKYETKEEIALVWIMEKCYNKKWDGEKWI